MDQDAIERQKRRELLEAKLAAHEMEESRRREALKAKRMNRKRNEVTKRGLQRSFTAIYSSSVHFEEDDTGSAGLSLNFSEQRAISPDRPSSGRGRRFNSGNDMSISSSSMESESSIDDLKLKPQLKKKKSSPRVEFITVNEIPKEDSPIEDTKENTDDKIDEDKPNEDDEKEERSEVKSRRGRGRGRGKGRPMLRRAVSERVEISTDINFELFSSDEKRLELDEEEREIEERRRKLREKLEERKKEREKSRRRTIQADKLKRAQERMELEKKRKEKEKLYHTPIYHIPKDVDWKSRQVENVDNIEASILEYSDFFDDNDHLDYEKLRSHLMKQGRISKRAFATIIEKASDIFSSEDTVLEVTAPAVLVGDIHGQFYDMLHMFLNAGSPVETQYLFLGDYVDRGLFSTEIIILLYSLKISYPFNFWMIRGNHEARMVTRTYGFYDEMMHKFDFNLYSMVMTSFDNLPLAAIVTSDQGRFFCCHGGLSSQIKTIEDINSINRFQEPLKGPLVDILWADPNSENPERAYVVNVQRGCSFFYGFLPVLEFLEKNNFLSIIRAHQVKDEGYEEMKYPTFSHDREHPLVITIFSAPNYCDFYKNQAAFMKITKEGYQFSQFDYQEHPYIDSQFRNAFELSLPQVAYRIQSMLKLLEDHSSPTSRTTYSASEYAISSTTSESDD
eukprot:TRINITY_DN2559_c0_g2_i2.p1 TRINITY_DN2559_c0_g2~~TRINITY_DN2559_c0_g2_i2.p1  ORF type:complete len:678 (+),score=162.52 TRINITY_DN2559_c0_g2_i2:46-2079(+)